MARGLPRDTKNNPDHWEILLQFLSAVLCQHFPIVLKDFAVVYYVTMAPYNSKSMFAWARSVGVLSKGTRFVYQVQEERRAKSTESRLVRISTNTSYYQLSYFNLLFI